MQQRTIAITTSGQEWKTTLSCWHFELPLCKVNWSTARVRHRRDCSIELPWKLLTHHRAGSFPVIFFFPWPNRIAVLISPISRQRGNVREWVHCHSVAGHFAFLRFALLRLVKLGASWNFQVGRNPKSGENAPFLSKECCPRIRLQKANVGFPLIAQCKLLWTIAEQTVCDCSTLCWTIAACLVGVHRWRSPIDQ